MFESGSDEALKMTKPIKRISIEELRSCTGFENYSDEEAQKTILTLEALSILFFELHQKSLREKEKNIPSKA